MTEAKAGAATDLAAAIASDSFAILERLIAFDTTSSNSNLELIEYAEAYLRQHSVAARRVPSDDGVKANLIATIGPAVDGGIVLSGHTDVVPVAGQAWSSEPFLLLRKEDRLYGRGTSDMKSFIALALAAVPHLVARPQTRPVHLAFSYDEEVGCLGAPRLIRDLLAQGLHPAAVVVGEPTDMRIVNSHKSIDLFEVVVTGREAHSSLVHEGLSANMVAIDLLSALAKIAQTEAQEHRDPRFNPPWSTLTVGTIQGGTAANILARECRFTFDLRSIPQRDPAAILAPFWRAVDEARQTMAEVADAVGIGVEHLASVPALRREADGTAEQLAAALTGHNEPASAVSYGAEAGQFQAAGISTIICGPGSIDQAHRADEYIEIEQIELGAQFFERLITFVQMPAESARL